MGSTPLNPDALKAGHEAYRRAYYKAGDSLARCFEKGLSAYLAVAQPVVNSADELVTTPAGRALANASFNEGLSAGIIACNDSLDGEPFVKPVSPYRPEVKP